MNSSSHQSQRSALGFAPPNFLLESFSSKRIVVPSDGASPQANDALWESEAVHRAKNLAQLASSLAQVGTDRLGLDRGFQSDAESLAAAYVELAADAGSPAAVPCASLLQRISTALASLSAKGTNITLCAPPCDVFLTPDRRRALLLIASELVINGLKYAFPDTSVGTIRVSLARVGDRAHLIVEDDGVGFQNLAASGIGSGLVAAMSDFLGGHIERGNRSQGGARVVVWFPVRTDAL